MRSFVKPHTRWPGLWKAYLFAGALVLVGASWLYTLGLIKRLEEEPRIMSRVFARFCMTAAVPEISGDTPETGIIFEEVIQKINFPVIVTDSGGFPLAWRGVAGIDDATANPEEATGWPDVGPQHALYRVKAALARLNGENRPIPMMVGADSTLVGYVYYGEPGLLKELRYVPLAQIGIVALFVWIGFIGFRAIKVNEQRALWVGLAKEAAHQLGTPISSLMGWLALLKEGSRTPAEVIPEMEGDLAHLERVLGRFNQIGSVPRLAPARLSEVLAEAVAYFEHRTQSLGKRIAFSQDLRADCRVNLNRDLFTWAVENLIKNALDATDRDSGRIEIATGRAGDQVELTVADNGRGIQPAHQGKVFAPGFTTKPMGWGLGLSLVKRIVEDYHGGRVRLVSSRPGSTVFAIILPAAPDEPAPEPGPPGGTQRND